jgi:ADP-heptose:LPS heptosyltransferase
MNSPQALIVHTGGGLGDVLLSRPVIDALVQGGYTVDFLARESTSVALAGHPGLRDLLTISGKDPVNAVQMKSWAKTLRQRGYQTALLLWSTSRWAWTLRWAKIPQRVGQDSRVLYSFNFTHPVKVRSEHGDQHSHWTEVLLDYPRALGLRPGPAKVTYPLSPAQHLAAKALLEQSDFGQRRGPLVGFHSGKGLPLGPERWPVGHFTKLARELQDHLDARLVLTGGPGEIEIVRSVAAGLGAGYLNLAGRTDLPTLAAVAARCQVFVCPDSGPMHLAAAVGTPVVGIYALDEDFPQRWAPFGVAHRVIRPPRPACPPGCKKPTCPHFSCYLKVAPSEVCRAVQELLKESGSEAGNRLPL